MPIAYIESSNPNAYIEVSSMTEAMNIRPMSFIRAFVQLDGSKITICEPNLEGDITPGCFEGVPGLAPLRFLLSVTDTGEQATLSRDTKEEGVGLFIEGGSGPTPNMTTILTNQVVIPDQGIFVPLTRSLENPLIHPAHRKPLVGGAVFHHDTKSINKIVRMFAKKKLQKTNE